MGDARVREIGGCKGEGDRGTRVREMRRMQG